LRKINTKRILPIRLIKALNHSMEHLLFSSLHPSLSPCLPAGRLGEREKVRGV
jgi:hypothetical protein